jgi:hypothetical protein
MPTLDGGGKYVSAKTCKTGDSLVFKNAGEYRDSKFMNPEKKMDGTPHPMAGKPKRELVFEVEVNGQPMVYTCNSTNQAILKDAWGRKTEDWVGKKCNILIGKVNVGGQLKDSVQLSPEKEVTSTDEWDQ